MGLEQAANVDGATPFQTFRRVIVRFATWGLVTTLVIVFIICWNDFVFAISLPVLLLMLFFQRRIVAGLTAGAVKG